MSCWWFRGAILQFNTVVHRGERFSRIETSNTASYIYLAFRSRELGKKAKQDTEKKGNKLIQPELTKKLSREIFLQGNSSRATCLLTNEHQK